MLSLVSPFPERETPRIWRWIEQFRSKVADDYSPKTLDAFVKEWQDDHKRGTRSWGVVRDGELGGVVKSILLGPGIADLHAIFKREFWGHKTTLAALRMVCEELFEPPEMRKLLVNAFHDNRPSISMACALGGLREGTLRGHTMRDGVPIDVVLIGIHREGFFNGISRQSIRDKREPQQQLTELSGHPGGDKHGDEQRHDGPHALAIPAGAHDAPVELHERSAH